MTFKRFSWLIGIRLFLILSLLALLVLLISLDGYHAATLLVGLSGVAATWELIHFVSKTNEELQRFLDAARYADFSQRFDLRHVGSGFDELGDTFNDILGKFRDQRSAQEEDLRHLKALLEHVPVPLLSGFDDGRVKLWNNAARRLFGTAKVTQTSDLNQFGSSFADAIIKGVPGQRLLVPFEMETRSYQVTVSTAHMIISGKMEKLISLQNIQSELDSVQLQAWQDLVRVLTHEIMNSITPVSSLAGTTVDLVDDARQKAASPTAPADLAEDLSDIRDAVETVARRSESLMHFVGSYRKLTRLPAPEKQTIPLADLLAQMIKLAAQEADGAENWFSLLVEPATLELDADPAMLEQVLLNLLKNSILAAQDAGNSPQIDLRARINKRGQLVLTVADNGGGVPAEMREKIFVPFFTTRRDGSGVGLALTRQIMIAHGGAVTCGDSDSGGALFTLTF